MTRKKAVLAGIVILGLGLGWLVGGMLVSDDPQPLAASDIGSLPSAEEEESAPRQDVPSGPSGQSQGQPDQPQPEQPQPEQPEEPADDDADDDGVKDDSDNCPQTPNADQQNFDGDSKGDACDADDDNDGLSDNSEAGHGTNPFKKDTDGDGWTDGHEVKHGYDPLDPSSHPVDQIKL